MPEPVPAPPPSLRELFTGFFGIGIVGFGGVLPWARRLVVEDRRWLSAAEFTDMLALCQFLPGPNVANVAVALGVRFHGVAGALATLTGLFAAPMGIVIGLGVLYGRYGGHPAVAHLFSGLAAAASGLVLSLSLRIAAPLRRKPAEAAMAAVAFLAMTLLRLPLLPTMLVLAPASVLIAWRRDRAARAGQPG